MPTDGSGGSAAPAGDAVARARRTAARGRAILRVYDVDTDRRRRGPGTDAEELAVLRGNRHRCPVRANGEHELQRPGRPVGGSEGIGGPALGESPYLPERERIERIALQRVRVGRQAGRGGAFGGEVVRAERDLTRDDDLAARVAEREVDEVLEAVPAVPDHGSGQLSALGTLRRVDDLRNRDRVGVTGPLYVQPEGGAIGRHPYTGVDVDGLILGHRDGNGLLDRDQAEVRPRSLRLHTSRRGGRYRQRYRCCKRGQKRDRGAHGSGEYARSHWLLNLPGRGLLVRRGTDPLKDAQSCRS